MTDRTRRQSSYSRQSSSDQLSQWRRALADHNANRRNRRGKRPAKPTTGIRVPPPKESA